MKIKMTIGWIVALMLAGCGAGEQATSEGKAGAPAVTTQAKVPEKPKILTTQGGLEMALIPAGEFTMGDDAGNPDEKPAHKVSVGAFLMDTREVTQKSYESLMRKNPARSQKPEKPVERVDWYMAVMYCNMRSRQEGLKPCYDPNTLACDFEATGYRLPTEAEWEYACRAGSQGRFGFGNEPGKLANYAWFKACANRATHPVGQKSPNAWGLYDMHGNVAEWCQDVYDEAYYQKNEARDPRGPAAGEKRVLRGGSWSSDEDGCRAAARASENARLADACFGSDTYGFRCVRRPGP